MTKFHVQTIMHDRWVLTLTSGVKTLTTEVYINLLRRLTMQSPSSVEVKDPEKLSRECLYR